MTWLYDVGNTYKNKNSGKFYLDTAMEKLVYIWELRIKNLQESKEISNTNFKACVFDHHKPVSMF